MQTDPNLDRAVSGLATRCTACGTAFRVVQDQLKVSEGWVRCGQCASVFNALEGLFDLDAAGAARGTPAVDPGPTDNIDPSMQETVRAELGAPEMPGPAPAVDQRPALEHAETRLDAAGPGASPAGQPATDAVVLPSASEPEPLSTLVPDAEPEFVRRARPVGPLRAALGWGSAALLAAVLLLQGVHHYRNDVAARWPVAGPVLLAGCEVLACSIRAPQRIDGIVVESSSLTRLAALPESFRLGVVVRNRAGMTLAAPSIDLALTDAGGQVVARKVLAPGDFQASAPALPPGSETPWQVLLSAAPAHVTGYTIEAFYP